MRQTVTFVGTVVGMIVLLPQAADACPICFGGAESPIRDSARLGVLTLASVTVCVLGVFGAWVRRLARLERDYAPSPQLPTSETSSNLTASRRGTRTTSNG